MLEALDERAVEPVSITKTRHFFEKSGCGTIITAVVGLMLIIGFLWSGNCTGGPNMAEGPKTSIGSVGDRAITAEAVDRYYTQLSGQLGESPDPAIVAQNFGRAVSFAANDAVFEYLATQNGISIEPDSLDQEVNKVAAEQAEQTIAFEKQTLGVGKSEADFALAFKNKHSMSPSEFKEKQAEQIKADLQDPEKAATMYRQVIQIALVSKLKAGKQFSDDDIKKSYDTWITKRVFADAFKKDPNRPDFPAARERMEKVKAALDGGMDFEAAMNQFSDDPVAPGKKTKSESTIDYERSNLEHDRNLKPILSLKPGETTAIVDTGSGAAIYRLVRLGSSLPKDWEKSKAQRVSQLQDSYASNEVYNRVVKAKKDGTVKWTSKGFKAIFDWAEAKADPDLATDEAKRREAFQKAYEDAKAVLAEGGGLDERPATLAEYGAFEDLWKLSSDEQRNELKADRVEVLTDILTMSDSLDLRMELANLLIDQKKPDEALEQVSSAAQLLFTYDEKSIANYKRVDAMNAKLAAAGVDAESLKLVNENLDTYRNGAFEFFKSQAESNQDYSPTGEALNKQIQAQMSVAKGLGFITDAQVSEVAALIQKYKVEKKKLDDEAAAERKKLEEETKAQAEKDKAAAKAGTSGTGSAGSKSGSTFGQPGATGQGTAPPTNAGKGGK
ncbi:MAG: hypothetical protein HZC36_10380 [Armatimonadetes bacterium]|nr:hypothetical protein [Armatimonadota bacterium]